MVDNKDGPSISRRAVVFGLTGIGISAAAGSRAAGFVGDLLKPLVLAAKQEDDNVQNQNAFRIHTEVVNRTLAGLRAFESELGEKVPSPQQLRDKHLPLIASLYELTYPGYLSKDTILGSIRIFQDSQDISVAEQADLLRAAYPDEGISSNRALGIVEDRMPIFDLAEQVTSRQIALKTGRTKENPKIYLPYTYITSNEENFGIPLTDENPIEGCYQPTPVNAFRSKVIRIINNLGAYLHIDNPVSLPNHFRDLLVSSINGKNAEDSTPLFKPTGTATATGFISNYKTEEGEAARETELDTLINTYLALGFCRSYGLAYSAEQIEPLTLVNLDKVLLQAGLVNGTDIYNIGLRNMRDSSDLADFLVRLANQGSAKDPLGFAIENFLVNGGFTKPDFLSAYYKDITMPNPDQTQDSNCLSF